MKNLFRFTILFVLLLSLSACGSSQEETNPAAVIEAADALFNAKDVDGFLALYAEDAVVKNGRGLFYGREDTRDLTTAAMDAFSIDCGNYLVYGNEVSYECLETFFSDGRLQGERYDAIIVDGKIQVEILAEKFVPQKEFKIDSTLP